MPRHSTGRQDAAVATDSLCCCSHQVSLEPESLPAVSVSADAPAGWKGDLLAVAVTSDTDLQTSGEHPLLPPSGQLPSLPPWWSPDPTHKHHMQCGAVIPHTKLHQHTLAHHPTPHHHHPTTPSTTRSRTHASGDKDAPDRTVSIKSDPMKQLDASLGGALGELLAGGDFDGKPGSASKAMRLSGGGAAGPKYVALLGLGKAEELGKTEGPQWGASPYQVCDARTGGGVRWGDSMLAPAPIQV